MNVLNLPGIVLSRTKPMNPATNMLVSRSILTTCVAGLYKTDTSNLKTNEQISYHTWSKTSKPTAREAELGAPIEFLPLTQIGIMRPKKRENPRMKRFRDELRSTNLREF